jgi:hypothetical protein
MGNHERLKRFHERLKVHYRQFWRPTEDFKYEVLRALDDNLPQCGRRGFILEPKYLIDTDDNEFIVDIVSELKGFETMHKRVVQERDQKRALSQVFRRQYADRIITHKVGLFFESGSTVAYVAKELADLLSTEVRIAEHAVPNITISTNNVLAYLLLWLKMGIPCSPFSWSAPKEETYGAWYGGLERLELQDPDYNGSSLDDTSQQEIRNLMDHSYRPSSK